MSDPTYKDRYDVIVVGGGVIGLSCAWRAAQRGLSVCVLERSSAGAGASGVAAGMLAPVGEAAFGEERLLELNLQAAKEWPRFAAELEGASGLATGFVTGGALHIALDRDEAEELRRRHEFQQRLGLHTEWLSPSRCRKREPGLSPGVAGGVLAADEASVDPRLLLHALMAAVRAAGGQLCEGAEVVAAILDEDRLAGVRLGDGRELAASTVVLAAGAWSGAEWLPPPARPSVRPVKGQVIRLRGAPGRLPCEAIVAGERFYAVPRRDGELVIGATVEERGFDTAVSAGGVLELLREAYRALPDLVELELVEMAAGLRPATPDNLPLIGPGAIEGLVLATGHFRNGLLLAPVTAARVADTLARDKATVT